MTYSIDYRKQVLSSIIDGMTIREASVFYGLSTSTIHSWQQNLAPKTTRNKAPTKIPDDALIDDVNALADALISDTINFSAPQLAAAANQLQPLAMGATNRIITDTSYLVSDAISTHSPTTANRSLWATIIGSKASHDTDNGISGYDAESTGVITGLDLPINRALNLGVAVSYIDTDIDTTSRLDHGITAKSWQVLGYGGYNITDATHLNFHAGAGRSDVDGTRRLPLLTNAIAQSDYNVDTLQAGLGVRHQIGTQERNFSPFGQVSYAQAKSDSYSESGAGAYNLNIDGNTYESMRWTAGLEIAQALSPRFSITGKLAAAIENGDKYSKVSANFAAMPDESFSTIGHEVGREIGVLGLGLSYQPTPRTTLSAGYQGEWRDNYDDQGASVSLQTWF
ncbi:autotransporter domain-containing protein [Psychrobacter faecalis]